MLDIFQAINRHKISEFLVWNFTEQFVPTHATTVKPLSITDGYAPLAAFGDTLLFCIWQIARLTETRVRYASG